MLLSSEFDSFIISPTFSVDSFTSSLFFVIGDKLSGNLKAFVLKFYFQF